MSESKRRGRPPTESSRNVFDSLLSPAEESLKDKRFKDITVREIAAKADVNTAMINYYFQNKEGLFVALIDHLFMEWQDSVKKLCDTLGDGDVKPSRAFAELVHHCFYRHAPILKLLLSELSVENSGIHAYYSQNLASRAVKSIQLFIKTCVSLGYYRKDIELRYISTTIALSAIYPITLDSTSFEDAFSISTEELYSPEWIAHLEDTLDRLIGAR